MATGQNIKASEYNAIRTKVEQILDTGGTVGDIRGYGQSLLSTPVVPGDEITRAQWEALRRDIINIKIHQENPKDSEGNTVIPFVIPIPVDEPIRFGSSHPNTNFNNLIDLLTVTSLQIAEGRSVIIAPVGESPRVRTTPWSTKVACEVTVNFTGYTRPDGYVVTPLNHARFYFNSGGRIRISSSRSGGSPTPQNNAWTALLVQAAIRELAAKQPATVNFYNLTETYKILYELSSSGAYAANKYTIEVKGANLDPATLIPRTIIFRVTWEDAYEDLFPSVDPPDRVDGTLSLIVEELKAAGSIFNSITSATPVGSWNIPSPSISVSDIFDA